MRTIGEEIQGDPVDSNAGKWKEFFLKPENLATTLVMATALTSERRRGQSGINKVLESGAAGLGFRGGLQAGVDQQRAANRQEERTVEQQAADIAAQRTRTEHEGQTVKTAQQRAEEERRANVANEGLQAAQIAQNAQPRPLNPSEIALQQAQAGYYNRLPGADGAAGADGLDGTRLLETLMEQETQRSFTTGEPFNMGNVSRGYNGFMMMERFIKEGKVDATGNIIATPEELAAMGIQAPAVSDGTPSPDDTRKPAPTNNPKAKNYRQSGIKAVTGQADYPVTHAVTVLKRQPVFEDADDATILDAVESARRMADKKEFQGTTDQYLEELLTTYGMVLSYEERANIRKELKSRKPATKYSFYQMR